MTVDRPARKVGFVPTPGESSNSGTTLQTVERALAFLEAVAEAPSPPQLRDVAQAIGLKVTTSYHLLNTLRRAGYVTRRADGSLRIGPRAAVLYNGLMRHLAGQEDLRPVIERLSAETLETAYLTRLTESGVVVQMVVEGLHAVRVSGLYVGFSGSEHERASGKAVLAHMGDEDRVQLLAKSTASMDPMARRQLSASLPRELEQIRQEGCALDEERFQKGASCVAAPYFHADGRIAGSVAVSVPCDRFTQARDSLTAAVQTAAAAVSQALGYWAPADGAEEGIEL
ncbi:MAG TPA: IclR family transcriptional regulator [Acidimicrobiales bacterium]|nr:IclR family transcriptional regulator [Acidimicrobiales bacterium]